MHFLFFAKFTCKYFRMKALYTSLLQPTIVTIPTVSIKLNTSWQLFLWLYVIIFCVSFSIYHLIVICTRIYFFHLYLHLNFIYFYLITLFLLLFLLIFRALLQFICPKRCDDRHSSEEQTVSSSRSNTMWNLAVTTAVCWYGVGLWWL